MLARRQGFICCIRGFFVCKRLGSRARRSFILAVSRGYVPPCINLSSDDRDEASRAKKGERGIQLLSCIYTGLAAGVRKSASLAWLAGEGGKTVHETERKTKRIRRRTKLPTERTFHTSIVVTSPLRRFKYYTCTFSRATFSLHAYKTVFLHFFRDLFAKP